MSARVAVVSGGNRGLGLAIVRELAARGLDVVLGSRSLEAGRAAAGQLAGLPGRVAPARLDIAAADSVSRFTIWLHREFGRCDVLVNNAAIAIDGEGDAATVDPDVVRRTFETNVLGTWHLTQVLVPAMRARRFGRVVNLSSGMGQLSTMSDGIPAYRVSKAAINALTRILAEELRDDGILVNSCCPGWVRTDMAGWSPGAPAEQAADTPVWLATLPPDGPTGGFFRNRQPLDW
jgi:NAD(P)-dependent dehydrogenase (short-subunit alcohol dehydrogenase family)